MRTTETPQYREGCRTWWRALSPSMTSPKAMNTGVKEFQPDYTNGSAHYLSPEDFAVIYNVKHSTTRESTAAAKESP